MLAITNAINKHLEAPSIFLSHSISMSINININTNMDICVSVAS